MSVITERPIRDAVRFETFNVGTEAPFVLDHSRLDVGTLADATTDPGDQWTDWTNNLVQIDIIRGGRQEGIEVRNDTGVLTITLRGIELGYPMPNFIKGQRVRVLHTLGGDTPLFTGQVLDVVAETTLDKQGNILPVLRITAVDAYAQHDTTTRHGALPDGGSETFTQRIARLSRTATAPIEPPVVNREPAFTPWAEQRRNHWKYPGDAATGTAGWGAYRTVLSNPGGFVRGTVNVAAGPGATGVIGLVSAAGMTPCLPGQVWTILGELRADGTTKDVQLGIQFFDAAFSYISGSQTIGPRMMGHPTYWQEAQVTSAPAPAGAAYFRVLALRADSSAVGDTIDLRLITAERGAVRLGAPFSGNTDPNGELERTRWLGAADSSASVIEAREFAGWSPLPDTVKALGRTVLESSMATHLTLACNTVGAMWWVGSDGVTRFAPREFDPYTAVTFLGAEPPPDMPADALHYVRPVTSAGSAAFFNRAVMHVHDAERDPETGEWIATDYDYTTVHLGSPYGFSYAEISVNDSGATLGNSPVHTWLQPTSNFTPKATAIVWNAQEDLARVPELEIGRTVHLPTDYLTRDPWPWNVVIGVHHTITPSRWLTELTLIGVAIP